MPRLPQFRLEIEEGTRYVYHVAAETPEGALEQYNKGLLIFGSEEAFKSKPVISLVASESGDDSFDLGIKRINGVRQFGGGAMTKLGDEYLTSHPYWFENDMCSLPQFAGCEGNYEVSRRLRDAGVIDKDAGCEDDTESSALVVNFISKEAGLDFLTRLNAYMARNSASRTAR